MQLFCSIRTKILFFTLACIAVIALAGNLFIYQYLSNIITTKANTIDSLNMSFIKSQINNELNKAWTLVNSCASNMEVISTAEGNASDYRAFLQSQEVLNNAINGSGLSEYINQMMVFRSQDNFMIQANTQRLAGNLLDPEQLRSSELFQQSLKSGFSDLFVFSPFSPLTGNTTPCLVSIRAVSSGLPSGATAWLYTEFSFTIFEDVLSTFDEVGSYFITGKDGTILCPPAFQNYASLSAIQENPEFALHSVPLDFDFVLYSITDSSLLNVEQTQITHTALLTLITTLVSGFGVSFILSSFLTKPILRLTHRIKRISENDLSFDPCIEQGNDEISQIGKVVNEMTLSVQHLLNETKEQAEHKRKIEIAMLQSQVNPHFLYNTLDSIHWMAVIQKNTGIQQMTRSLSNLLKNMAKGYDQKVPLGEEVKLLEDYVNIQSIRYMDTFELKNEIPADFFRFGIIKLTLQPLVENAIFHGIEPTGRFGIIRLSAWEQEGDLCIAVEDNGVGMSEETIQKALSGEFKPGYAGMNGIGVGNVHQRLKLVYGEPYGLSIVSVPNEYTRMIITIPKEEVVCNELSGSFGGR